MAANLGKMTAAMVLESQGFTAQLAAVQAKTDQFGKTVQSHFTRISDVGSSALSGNLAGVLTGFGVGAGATGLITTIQNQVKETMSLIVAQGRLSRAFNLSSESAAAYLNLGRRVGIDSGELTRTLQVVARHIGEARLAMASGETGGEFVRSLQLLGFNAQEFVNLPMDQFLERLGPALQNVVDPTDRAAIAFGILSRHGEALLPFLERAGDLGQIRDLVRATGEAAAESAPQVRAARREWELWSETIKSAIQGFENQVVIGAGQGLQRLRRQGLIEFLRPGAMFEDAARQMAEFAQQQRGNQAMTAEELDRGREKVNTQQNLARQLRIQTAIDQATNSLREQAHSYGMVAEEAQRARLIQQGATAAQLAEFDQLAERMRELRRQQEDRTAIEQTQRQFQAPLEAFRERMNQLRRIAGNGTGLNERQFGMAGAAALEQLERSLGDPGRLASALVVGSVEAVSELNRQRADTRDRESPQERLRRVLEESQRIQQSQDNHLREIVDALRSNPELQDLLTGGPV